jgi:hypothetical protein
LLIDEEVIVDVLVAYGFHTESRMLVMAETGYPDYLLAHAVRLMRDQPELPVYLLARGRQQYAQAPRVRVNAVARHGQLRGPGMEREYGAQAPGAARHPRQVPG